MDKAFEAVLGEAARALLRATEGPGFWRKHDRSWKPIKNPLLGLTVGDVVLSYDTYDYRLTEHRVASVHGGVAYCIEHIDGGEPHVWPITASEFATTVEGVIQLYREVIESDMQLIVIGGKRLRELVSLVGDEASDMLRG